MFAGCMKEDEANGTNLSLGYTAFRDYYVSVKTIIALVQYLQLLMGSR